MGQLAMRADFLKIEITLLIKRPILHVFVEAESCEQNLSFQSGEWIAFPTIPMMKQKRWLELRRILFDYFVNIFSGNGTTTKMS